MIGLVVVGWIKNFVAGYWKLILPVVILAVVVLSFKHLEKQRDVAVEQLVEYKQAQALAVAKQTADNKVKEITAQKKVDDTVVGATAILTQLHLNQEKSTTDLKDLYEGKISKLKHDMAWRPERVLSPDSSGNSSATSDSSGNPDNGSCSSQECNRTLASLQGEYGTLEQACKIETVDFNVLRGWADSVCETVVCVNNESKP